MTMSCAAAEQFPIEQVLQRNVPGAKFGGPCRLTVAALQGPIQVRHTLTVRGLVRQPDLRRRRSPGGRALPPAQVRGSIRRVRGSRGDLRPPIARRTGA
jgi:hypothetical protein